MRRSRQMDRDLTRVTCFQVGGNQLTSLPAEIGQLPQLELLYVRHSYQLDRDLTSSLYLCSRPTTISSNGCRPSWASCRSSGTSMCDAWVLLISFLTHPPSFSFTETYFQRSPG